MILWSIAFAFGAMSRSPVMIALCGAALLHLGFDFLLHNDDGRAHFWPLSNWVFQSPVSYWDPDHYGNIAGSIEVALSVLCCGVLDLFRCRQDETMIASITDQSELRGART